jgi:hypothetical protein
MINGIFFAGLSEAALGSAPALLCYGRKQKKPLLAQGLIQKKGRRPTLPLAQYHRRWQA